jgi:AmmeMemoRadiSam system protein A
MDPTPPRHAPPDARPTDIDRLGRSLLDVADASLRRAFHQRVDLPDPHAMPPEAHERHGAFVTVHVADELNGCIGTLQGDEPLAVAVERLVRQAAFDDPRLPPLRADQLGATELEVSVLSPLEPIAATAREVLLDQLEPTVHGLVIARARRRGVFLPDVWSQFPEPDRFLDRLVAKAGLHPSPWPDRLQAWRFTTRRWSRHLAR